MSSGVVVDIDVNYFSDDKNLKFCPIESQHTIPIISGARVVTPYGVGIVKSYQSDRVTVTLPWGTAYINEKYLDFNVLPYILRNVDVIKGLGDRLLRKKEYVDAAVCYERAFKLLPKSFQNETSNKTNVSNMCCIIALCHLRSNNYERALQWCQTSLKFDIQNTTAWLRLGQSHSRIGNYEEADDVFKKVANSLTGQEKIILQKEMEQITHLLEKRTKLEKRNLAHVYGDGSSSVADSSPEDDEGPSKRQNVVDRRASTDAKVDKHSSTFEITFDIKDCLSKIAGISSTKEFTNFAVGAVIGSCIMFTLMKIFK